MESDLNEERSRYQNLLTEHLRLEEKYDDLKEEITLSVVRHTHTAAQVRREQGLFSLFTACFPSRMSYLQPVFLLECLIYSLFSF